MRTAEERVALLHKRAAELKRETDRRWIAVLIMGAVCILAVLIAVLAGAGGIFSGSAAESPAGSALMIVLAAALAVLVIAAIRKAREMNREKQETFGRETAEDSGFRVLDEGLLAGAAGGVRDPSEEKEEIREPGKENEQND